VVLGFMEVLSAVSRKVGFFRPMVSHGVEEDDLTNLIRSRYDLPFDPEMLYGCTAETALKVIADRRSEELVKIILTKFKALEEKCDLVICAGTDYDGIVPSLEFDFNARMANNLGCLIVAVVTGAGRSPEETLDAARFAHESLRIRGGELLATVINRASVEHLNLLKALTRNMLPDSERVYVLPEHPSLGMPTVREIRKALNADCVCGEGDAENQIVTNYKVAFGRDARLSHPIAALPLRAIEACYYSSRRLALGCDGRTLLSRKPICAGYTKKPPLK